MEEDKKSGIICRVCLDYDFQKQPDGRGLSLFEMYNDCLVSDQINALTNVAIKQGDGLPDMICTPCLLELENAIKFKQKCENTNEILLSAVNNAPTQIESLDVVLPMKEEYLDDANDEDFDYVDDNITLADLQAACADIKPLVGEPKPSRAIDLKLICNECGGSFKSKCKLRVHWKKVHLTENLKCPNCLRRFKSILAMKSHVKRNLQACAASSKVRIEGEGRHRMFHCKECDYKSVRIKTVTAHTTIHSGERPFQCNLCPKAFSQLSSLTSHKEGVHKIIKKEGTCHFCGKHIQGRTKQYRHMKSHRAAQYLCTICNTALKTSGGLNNHMKRHSGVKGFSCEVCPTSFFTYSELYNHRTKVHLKTKGYKCELCSYKSASHTLMGKHRSKHAFSDFPCTFCGTFCDNEQQLALHVRRHTEKNIPCPHCDKTYFSRKNLGAHVRKIHKLVKLSGTTLKNNSVKSECS